MKTFTFKTKEKDIFNCDAHNLTEAWFKFRDYAVMRLKFDDIPQLEVVEYEYVLLFSPHTNQKKAIESFYNGEIIYKGNYPIRCYDLPNQCLICLKYGKGSIRFRVDSNTILHHAKKQLGM